MSVTSKYLERLHLLKSRIIKLEAVVQEQAKRIGALEARANSMDAVNNHQLRSIGALGKDARELARRIVNLEIWRDSHLVDPATLDPVGKHEPDCLECASLDVDGDEPPCVSCVNNSGADNNWTPKRDVTVRRNAVPHGFIQPVEPENNPPATWTTCAPESRPEEPPKNCDTCRHSGVFSANEPCISCESLVRSNWMPKSAQSKPSIADDLMAGVRSVQAVAANIPMPLQPELVEGFWYVDRVTGKNGKIARLENCSQPEKFFSLYRPATLDDLAHEVEGVKVWMVERENCIVQMMYNDAPGYYGIASWGKNEYPIAREYAAACNIPIICEAQWKELTT